MKKPTLFGKYLLLERINVGGMAEVFIAKAFGVEGFERILAIKKILPTMAEDEEFITMFIDEARISVQLNHANIVHIHELGRHDDTYFIAMEYVAGRDVRTILERYRRRKEIMPTAQAVFITSKICEGLDYAHRKKDARGQDLGIIHRDVSPQNILISYEGDAKVIDFGIAKAANRSQKTQAGILKGKFGYMSPEQVRGMPIDRRSDIFAVGVLLYEMLTGEKLFVGESDFSTLEKVRNADVPLPSEFNPNIPKGLEKVVLKALAREPEDRYQWASDLQEDLMRFLLAGDAIYSSKHLSAYMKEAFAEDMLREAEKMERYAGIERPEQIETASVSAPPPQQRQQAPAPKRAPPPSVVVAGTPAGRSPTAPSQPAPAYIPPPSADELAEMDGGGADKTQIVDSTQTFRAPETRIADSSVVVGDSDTGRTDTPMAGGTDSAYGYPEEPETLPPPGARKGKSGPKAQVVIGNEDGEGYAGATMIGPAPTSRPNPKPDVPGEDEATGSLTFPQSARAARGAQREPEPEEEQGGYDDPRGDEDLGAQGGAYDDYGQESDDQDRPEQQEEAVTGSLPAALAPKKAAKGASRPEPKAQKAQKAQVAVKSKGKGAAVAKKSPPRAVLFAAAAGIVLLLVVAAVLALRSPSTGEVTFSVSPSKGARIVVDGIEYPTGTMVSLPPGRHKVTATAPGHQRQDKVVEVSAGGVVAVSLQLEPAGAQPSEEDAPPQNPSTVVAAGNNDPGTREKPPEPAGNTPPPEPRDTPPANAGTGETTPPTATVQTPEATEPARPRKVAAVFRGEDGAEVSLDGKSLGRTPGARARDLEVGKTYKFSVKLAGYKLFRGRFTPDGSSEEVEVPFELEKEPEKAPVVEREPVRRPTPPTPKPPVTKSKAQGGFACSTKPAGADIIVDGKKVDRKTPVPVSNPLMLPVGNRKISFRLNGKTTKPQVVTISEGNVEKLIGVAIE
jgi:serine/threonine protein kinase